MRLLAHDNTVRDAYNNRLRYLMIDEYDYRGAQGRRDPWVDPRVPEEQALMAQPLGTALFALKKLPNVMDATVAIVGNVERWQAEEIVKA